jgi:hypothetical protein
MLLGRSIERNFDSLTAFDRPGVEKAKRVAKKDTENYPDNVERLAHYERTCGTIFYLPNQAGY